METTEKEFQSFQFTGGQKSRQVTTTHATSTKAAVRPGEAANRWTVKRTGPAPPARPGGQQGAGCPLLPNLPASSSRGLARRQQAKGSGSAPLGRPGNWGLGPLLAPETRAL